VKTSRGHADERSPPSGPQEEIHAWSLAVRGRWRPGSLVQFVITGVIGIRTLERARKWLEHVPRVGSTQDDINRDADILPIFLNSVNQECLRRAPGGGGAGLASEADSAWVHRTSPHALKARPWPEGLLPAGPLAAFAFEAILLVSRNSRNRYNRNCRSSPPRPTWSRSARVVAWRSQSPGGFCIRSHFLVSRNLPDRFNRNCRLNPLIKYTRSRSA
jgi:hypothetical protein